MVSRGLNFVTKCHDTTSWQVGETNFVTKCYDKTAW